MEISKREDITRKYKISKNILGDGATSLVFAAENSKKEKFAIKRISKEKNKINQKIMLKEAEICLKLNHKNIIKYYEIYEDMKYINIVMEQGQTDLFEFLIRSPLGYFPDEIAIDFLIQIFSSIDYLHSLNLIHCDIKPENFILKFDTNKDELKLVDFGNVRRKPKSKEKLYNFCGTKEYMAPEALDNTGFDEKVDEWAVGVIMYNMLTGADPFNSDNDSDYKDNIKFKDIKVCEYNKTDMKDREIEVSYEQINDLLGTEIPKEEVLNVYRKLGFSATDVGSSAKVIVPRRRLDISIPEDLIEEVSRIYGVDNIEGKLPIVPMKRGSRNNTIREIRRKMVNLGLNETLTYVLVNDKEVHKYTNDEFEELRLLDPMTEERNVLRYSLIPSLVKTYEYNKAHYNKDVSIFEIGKGFWKKGEEYGENSKLCALMTGNYFNSLGNEQKVDFYVIKGIAEEILDYLGYSGRYSFVKPKQDICEFHPYQTAEISVNADVCGIVGKLHPNETKEDVFVLEINLDKLLEKKTGKMNFKEISKFPSVNEDLAVVVDKSVTAAHLQAEIKRAGGKLFQGSKVFDVFEGTVLGSNKKSIAVSLTFGAPDRTLTDEEVNAVLNQIIERLEKGLKAELRK